jgi:predicted metal-dependent HD superfamily phosphohydrolase
MEEVLHKIWKNLSLKYMSEDYSLKLWKEIVKKYSKRRRHYHNLEHIFDIVNKYYFNFEHKLKRPDEVLFAIFYHDLIYDIGKDDNEVHSGVFMDARLKPTKLTENQLSFIFECIHSTRNHKMNLVQDVNYMLDFDMAILGQTWSEYSRYRKAVRKEYRIYPNCMYNAGRIKVLKSFLSQDRIFNTDDFYNLYEEQARENIQKELDFLENS